MDSFRPRFETLAIEPHLGGKLFGLFVEQHDAAAIGFDPFEDQLHDAIEQLVDIERMAYRQGRAIHDLQFATCPGEQGLLAPSKSRLSS